MPVGFECCCQYYKAIALACDSLIVEALRQQTELRRLLSAKNLKQNRPKVWPWLCAYQPAQQNNAISAKKTNFTNKYQRFSIALYEGLGVNECENNYWLH